MSDVEVANLLALPAAERLRLTELLWESLQPSADDLPLSDELRAELDRRLAEQEAGPDQGVPWDQVRESLFGPRASAHAAAPATGHASQGITTR